MASVESSVRAGVCRPARASCSVQRISNGIRDSYEVYSYYPGPGGTQTRFSKSIQSSYEDAMVQIRVLQMHHLCEEPPRVSENGPTGSTTVARPAVNAIPVR
jgi:hypothetical protein